MRNDTSSIRRLFLAGMITLAFVSMGLWGAIWIHGEYGTFKTASESLRDKHLEAREELLRNQVTTVVDYLRYLMSQTERRLRSSIREQVDEAWHIAMNIHKENRDGKTPAEIKKMIKDALRPIRFNNGRGYFFAFNLDGTSELFADRPEMEGRSMLSVTGGKGELVVRDMLDLIRARGEGFFEYTWTKPEEGERYSPKIAFVKLFEPYGWVIGTGEYLDDVKSAMQDEALDRMINWRFGKEGYFFGSTFQGGPLFSNGKITRGTENLWELTDPSGVKIFQAQKDAVRQPGGGFVRYSWRKLESEVPAPKLAFVMSVPEWEWIIGAGVYLDTVEAEIAQKMEALRYSLVTRIEKSFAILLPLILLILCFVRYLSNRLQAGMDAFSSFFEKAVTQSVTIDPKRLHFKEFRNVAHFANKMLSERKQVEEALRESEEKYRALVETTGTGYVILDTQGRVLDANREYVRLTGHGALEEILGRQVTEWTAPHDLARNAEEVVKCVKQGFVNNLEIDYIDGEMKCTRVEINATVVSTAEGVGIVTLCRDVTERKRAEDALRESEEKFSKAFYHAPLLMTLSDVEDGTYVEVNDKFIQVSGFSREEALGKTSIELGWISPKDRKRLIEELKTLGRVEGMELTLFTKDGKPVTCLFNGEIIKTDRGLRLLSIAQDITEHKRARREKERLEAQLRQAQKMEAIGTLAGGIAHDFNNILAGIMGYTEMALLDIPPEHRVRHDLEEVLKASYRARDLIKHILVFSRMRTGQEHQRIDVGPIVKEALKFLRASLPATIDIRGNIESDVGTILADPTQIHEILMNLCTNAAHAMEERGGVLEVTLAGMHLASNAAPFYPDAKPGPYLRLTVSDTGHGMDAETLEHIFEPYFTTKEVGKGTGFGLSVAHGIVQRHEGAITVHSEPEKGTTFHVYFPSSEDACSTDDEAEGGPVPKGTERILFVDDEEMVVRLAGRMLEELGYRVRTHTSSTEALALFRASPHDFDLIITDYTMPRMTGVDLAKEILLIRPDIPIILCTGFSEKISEAKAGKIGIKELVMKPFSMRGIADTIRKVIRGDKGRPE